MAYDFHETLTMTVPNVEEKMFSTFSESNSKNHALLVEISAIHEGMTSNFNNYSEETLQESVESWISPYPKPIIINHDLYEEPLGRVVAAQMAKDIDGTPFIKLQAAITDPEAISKILDQRYLTGSVGGKAGTAHCSVCKADWANASIESIPCKHRKGKAYKGQIAFMEMGDISWREYSFVNVPADTKSSVLNATAQDEAEENEDAFMRIFSLDMHEPKILELSESEEDLNILDRFSEKEAAPLYLQLKGAFLSAQAFEFEEAEAGNKTPKAPYGDKTPYADPGYQSDGVKRYPIDTKDHVRAAWSYINQQKNAAKYTPEQLKKIKSRIKSAAKKFGIDISDDKKESDVTIAGNSEEEDILTVADELSDDLASTEEGENDSVEEEESPQEDQASDEQDEVTEDTDEEIVEDSDDTEEEVTEEVVEEDDSEAEASDESEDVVEEEEEEEQVDDDLQEEEETEDSDDTQVSEAELNEKIQALESRVEELEATEQSLVEENDQLRNALKRTLAERVVDMKITHGIVSSDDRAEELEEHFTRSASSLADSIRDLTRMPSLPKETNYKDAPQMESYVASVKDQGNTVDEDSFEELDEQEVADPVKMAEDLFVDTFMGRRKL